MFPRKSSVLRFLFCVLSVTTFVVWWNIPSPESSRNEISSWNWVWWANETQLRLELSRIQLELNVSGSAANMTLYELQQHLSDMKKLLPVNPHWFNYIINPGNRVCSGKDIFILVYVHSAPNHFKQRMAIRETWGDQKNFPGIIIKVIFLCGVVSEKLIQDALFMESDAYDDIVQEDFVDSYRNLTYKGIMALKWVSTYCMNAKFLLKTDDDIFVNMYNLVAHLKSMSKHRGIVKNLLLCLVWYRMKVMRDPKSKWYLSPEEFEGEFFPTYCSGSAFILTTDVAASMFNASLYTPFFWVDDFYVTGLLAKKANVIHENFNSVYVLGPTVFLQKFTEQNQWLTLVIGHVHNLNHLKLVWRNVLKEHARNGSQFVANVISKP